MVIFIITAAAFPYKRKVFMEQQEFHKIFLTGKCQEGNKVLKAENDQAS